MLSKKAIPTDERLILALDVPSVEEAKKLVSALGDTVKFYKLGLEIFLAGGYYELIDWLTERGKKCFVDLKFFDVPNTVASAVRQLRGRHPQFVTVHGNDQILRAACDAKNGIKILAVTVLTSLDNADLKALGFQVNAQELVLSRARRALEIGCDGVISSGLEAEPLRRELGEGFLIVVPGIRPVANVDDQKRTVDVEDAFLMGADYVVVGRPIKDASDPKQAAQHIQGRIAKLFKR
ncbi:MAG TPA: orotidine-5'-phosphate decarboxylase [Alphaproteobacteria bacterium]|nr:orotidine-5'-phosphate decarboxylase [Alphaproteobacteria bacterium]